MKDLRKLRRILKLVPADRKHIGEEIIERITFMAGVLDDLQVRIQEHGTTDHFKQGVQEFDRESPALKSYNTTGRPTAIIILSSHTCVLFDSRKGLRTDNVFHTASVLYCNFLVNAKLYEPL